MAEIYVMGEEEVAPASAHEMLSALQIDEAPILEHLVDVVRQEGAWATHLPGDEFNIWKAFPPETSERLFELKLLGMAKRGLIDGCFCGCRGDYQITRKGLDALGIDCSDPIQHSYGVSDA